MALYRRGGEKEWWYHFWYHGIHIQQRTNTTDKQEARQKEKNHKAELQLEQRSAEPEENPKFSDFAVQYLGYSKASRPSYGVEFYYIDRTLSPRFGHLRLKQITPFHVEMFKQKRLADGLKKSSINREIGLLKSMLNRAVKWKQIQASAIRDAELFKLDDEPSDRVLSHAEEAQLMAACEESELRYRAPHLSAIISVALHTGLRRGEILRLRWADINFQKNVLIVQKSKTKAGKGRNVNLNSMLRKKLLALFEQEHGEWVFPSPKRFQIQGQPESHISDVKNAFRRAVSLAGIRPITFHQLRHTFCSRLADAGVPMPVIQDLAGHASITMTRRYTHPADERKQQAVEALLGSPKGLEPATEPATETLKSSGGQIVEVTNGSRSIS